MIPRRLLPVLIALAMVGCGLGFVVPAQAKTSLVARGYWLVAHDGGVFSFGDASYFGNSVGVVSGAGATKTIGITASAYGGYWLLSANGAVAAFGGAPSFGSTAGMQLNAPIVAMAATPSGNGYWEVAADGGVFSFGDARFYGSMGGIHLNAPVEGIAVP